MIDILDDNLVTLKQASKLLPGGPHISTIHRWRLRGVRGVKLETVMVGGRRFTSHKSIAEFVRLTTAATGSKNRPMDFPSPRQRSRQIGAAEHAFEVNVRRGS